MSELILKYNSLDAFRKQELLNFLEVLLHENQNAVQPNSNISEYKQKILKVGIWSERDTESINNNSLNFDSISW